MGDPSIWGILHLALVAYAALQILNSPADTIKKIIWIVVVSVFPLAGVLAWFFMGPGSPRKIAG